MSFDTAFRLIFGGTFVLIGLVLIALSFSKKWLASRGRAFARRNLAWVSEPLVAEFDAFTARRARAGGTTLLAAGAVIAVAPLSGHSERGQTFWLFAIVILAMYTVAAVDLWLFASRPNPGDSQVRVARVRSVSVDDYIWRWTRWSAWLIGFAAAAIAAGSVALSMQADVPKWVLGPGALAGLVALGVPLSDRIASRIVGTREPAEDPAHLYWQDALRAESIGRVYGLWMITFLNVAMEASLGFSHALRQAHQSGAAERVGDLMLPAAFVVAVIPLLLSMGQAGMSQQWFRRRLWPSLTPGQVLQPGQSVTGQVTA